MLVLPPVHAEALHDVANGVAHEVVVAAVREDLVVKEVVSEPAGLLPRDGEQACRGHGGEPRVVTVPQDGGHGEKHAEQREDLPGVERLARDKEVVAHELAAQAPEVAQHGVGLHRLHARARVAQWRRGPGKF